MSDVLGVMRQHWGEESDPCKQTSYLCQTITGNNTKCLVHFQLYSIFPAVFMGTTTKCLEGVSEYSTSEMTLHGTEYSSAE